MNTPQPARYPEKALQLRATEWLRQHWDYSEALADEEGKGARVDSLGLLDGRLTLIEVKVNVGASIIDHRPDRAHSLESKIAGALGPIYRRDSGRVAKAANRIWDRQNPPLVCVLAASYSSNALSALSDMLGRRSRDWHFDFAVWRWNGEAVEVLASSPRSVAPTVRFDEISMPVLIGRSQRAKARSIAELIALAEERGVGNLVSHFVRAASGSDFKVEQGDGPSHSSARWTDTPVLRPSSGHIWMPLVRVG